MRRAAIRQPMCAASVDWQAMKPVRRVIPTPAWLRPLIRGATRIAMNAPAWVPGWLKNAPLRLTALVLRAWIAIVR